MYSLLLDSANRDLNIGLVQNRAIIDRISYPAWQRQSELMVKEIDVILKRNNISAKDLSEVVVTIGPGSYTGIRIALTIAKTFAFALNIKIFAVSALIAQKVPHFATISVINARSNRSYVALYDKDGKTLIEDKVWNNEEVVEWVQSHLDYVLAGDASYLGLIDQPVDVLFGMLTAYQQSEAAESVLTLRPVYLKDLL
ncbi:MAG: tRNA (adenosine(37)-N6)-threonylcarbamoyltransferase complex dimerization subunit type 1 TsaB [Bacilli bacterium]|jgi:tRNA threonylcarbamoyl adenosine modification protein YeaZ